MITGGEDLKEEQGPLEVLDLEQVEEEWEEVKHLKSLISEATHVHGGTFWWCVNRSLHICIFVSIMSLGFQFNHTMDGSGFFGGGVGFAGGPQMSGSTPQSDGSQNQPTNKQTQSGSPVQQQLIQIGEHSYLSGIIKLKALRF